MLLTLLGVVRSEPLTKSPSRSRECSVYSRAVSRLTYSSEACLDVVDCFFHETSSGVGGAIYVASAYILYATATTFLGCSAPRLPLVPGFGGAICHNGISPEILRCCFREDTSSGYGNAISVSYSPTISSVIDCSFLECKDDSGSSWGGIYTKAGGQMTLIGLNFSDCVLSNNTNAFGAVLFADETAGTWTFSASTVVRCGGGSALDNYAFSVPRVELSNCYNNTCSASYSVLLGRYGGFEIDRCIFRGNTRELHIESPSSSQPKFSVTNCVFSGSLPSGDIYQKAVNNSVEMETASFAYLYFSTSACPNLWPAATPTKSPQATSEQTAEATPEPTLTATPEPTSITTREQTAEATPERTAQETSTDSPDASPTSHFSLSLSRAVRSHRIVSTVVASWFCGFCQF
jgi:hypothetical protein